ncbi:MAG: RluA family pseudouridine synthase [Clostridia bacterium]|nr:RluA family pseudouridine synthase [Clostridia bacterium]
MKILIVPEKFNNKKLTEYLQYQFKNLSFSTICKTLRKKDIRINEKRISENCLLKTGDEVKVYIADNILNPQIEITVVYEDENILVVDKPVGIEVTGESSLTTYIKEKFGSNIEPCHRLDRNTSGLLLFAKNEESLEIMNALFKNHQIEKHYVALVYGIPKSNQKKLEAYLFKDSKKSQVYISDKKLPNYTKIITNYTVLKTNTVKNISLLDVNIETGKTHQIRAHLAHEGLPIIGDGKYGINKINADFKQKTQLLASYSLTFFISENNKLHYLNNKTISKSSIPFINLI